MQQINIFNNDEAIASKEKKFLSTRYQGSKLKLLDWIWSEISDLKFESCLDAFGGTGSVAYLLKTKGKNVDYNDILQFNKCIGKAIIENNNNFLTDKDIENILNFDRNSHRQTFIQDTFKDIFYPDDENKWLDCISFNISNISNEFIKAIAYTALFQSCIIKRPYNLFHRANLYMRTSDVKRSFGNKVTWDKPFPYYFVKFAKEINEIIFDNGKKCRSFGEDIFNIDQSQPYDLVYIDTPYINEKGVGVDYLDFYHFLEGLTDYNSWKENVDMKYKHRRIKGEKSLWCQKGEIHNAFDRLFNIFKNSIIVVSYRSHGIPSEKDLIEILSRYKKVKTCHQDYKYALSHNNGRELLLIGT